jgi:hypothetical protein
VTAIGIQFCADCARHRAEEGRGYSREALRSPPYIRSLFSDGVMPPATPSSSDLRLTNGVTI